MVRVEHPKKPMNYYRLSDETWDKLSLKEKDYLIFLNERKYSKAELMRKLYIESRFGIYILIKKLKIKIKNDVEKLNRLVN